MSILRALLLVFCAIISSCIIAKEEVHQAIQSLDAWKLQDVLGKHLSQSFEQVKLSRLYGSSDFSEMRMYKHCDQDQYLLLAKYTDECYAQIKKDKCVNSVDTLQSVVQQQYEVAVFIYETIVVIKQVAYAVYVIRLEENALQQWDKLLKVHYHSLYLPETQYTDHYVMSFEDECGSIDSYKNIQSFSVATKYNLDSNISYKLTGSAIDLDREVHRIIQLGHSRILYYDDYKIIIMIQRGDDIGESSSKSALFQVSASTSQEQLSKLVQGELLLA